MSKNYKLLNPSDVLRVVVEHMEVPVVLIKSSTKVARVVEARHAYCYFLRHMLGYSFKEIALAISVTNHTTALSACQIHSNNIQQNPNLAINMTVMSKRIMDLGDRRALAYGVEV